jgi:hypothetical protein
MNVAVVYESWFGNTKRVAEAVAEGLGDGGPVRCVEVGALDPSTLGDIDLLVVGGPTQMHGMSSSMTQTAARGDKHRPGSPGLSEKGGVRQALGSLPMGNGGPAAAFDTRFNKSHVVAGAASKGIAKRLGARGYQLIAPPESFLVGDTPGPLLEGELDRARAWGASLREALAQRS